MSARTRHSPEAPHRSTTGCMRPKLRSRTKSKSKQTSKLKRASTGEDKPKPPSETKLPPTQPSSGSASSPRAHVLEPLYGLLSEVPQSMLFTFQVSSSLPPTCDTEGTSSSLLDTAQSEAERFASTGPEPMFDHSWRIAFVEARIPMEESRLAQVAPDQTILADSALPERHCDIPNSGSLVSVSSPSGSLTAPALRFVDFLDQDSAPASLDPAVQLVDAYGYPVDRNGVPEYPAHFHPSTTLAHPGHLEGVGPRDEPSSTHSPKSHLSQQETPVPAPWPPLYAPPGSFMHMPAPIPPILSSSSISIPSGLSSFVECDLGSMPYTQRRHSVPSFEQPQGGRFSQPSMSTLRPESRDCDTFGHLYLDLRLPPPPPLTSFPAHQPSPPLGLLWNPDHSNPTSHYISRTTHSGPFGIPDAQCPSRVVPYPEFQPPPSAPMTSIPLPVLQPTPCVPTPWCTLFDDLKRRTQGDPGTAKKKRRTSALTPERTCQPGLNDTQDNELAQQLHPCPLCPRVFPLPNSLALHLKWHWGASGLEWKRGINRNGKGFQRARREAEERQCRAAATHIEHLTCAFEPGVSANDSSTTNNMRRANGALYPSPVDNSNVVPGDLPFMRPAVPQASFEVFNMPYYSSSEASTSTPEVGGSPGISPFDSGVSVLFPRLPSLEELALPQPLAGNTLAARPCDTEFVLQEGLSQPSPGPPVGEDLQGAMSNHAVWSHNWFGCDNLDQSTDTIATQGDQDLDDLLGNHHPFIEVHADTKVNGQDRTRANVYPPHPDRCVSDKRVASSVSHYRARSPASSSWCSSPANDRSASLGSSAPSTSPNSLPGLAPRPAPPDLPPPPPGARGDDEVHEVQVHVASRRTAAADMLLAALAPLSDLIALPPPPPELDTFGELSLLLS